MVLGKADQTFEIGGNTPESVLQYGDTARSLLRPVGYCFVNIRRVDVVSRE
jgi:hypothetical protein